MKKTIKLISLLLATLFLLSSCQAVYDVPLTPPETTANPDIDLNDEYYTTGIPYYTGNIYEGMLYEGCLIYIEQLTTTGIVGERTSAEGVKIPTYGDVQVDRIVKYNPVTGVVSSPCLDPACNHSLESGCPMLLGLGRREDETYRFKGIFGDWLVYMQQKSDDEYSVRNTEIMYNLKTGECRNAFVDDLGSEKLSRWTSGIYHDGKYYKVNAIMDYSNTGYKPGSGQSLSDFEPETRRYLYEYDFNSNVTKELYEINADWSLGKVSNERFYFRDSNSRYLSIKKDGTDEREEDAVNVSNTVGTFTIFYNPNGGYTVHDLKTNEMKDVSFEYSLIGIPCVTEKGILTAHQTKYDKWRKFDFSEYRKEHPGASSEQINNEARKILASGTAQIWQCGYMGEDNHMLFELPAARIEIISSYGDYVFAKVSKYNTQTGAHLDGYNNSTCCINIKTGEITPIPELEIVVPYWYTN